jgi:hypothetical protein
MVRAIDRRWSSPTIAIWRGIATERCSKNRGDPHSDDRDTSFRHFVISLFKERQEIFDYEVAGDVHQRADNHQHKGQPNP